MMPSTSHPIGGSRAHIFFQCLEPKHDVIPASQKGEVNLVSRKGEVNLASQATPPDSQHQDVIFASR
jgi:hypothetical protein